MAALHSSDPSLHHYFQRKFKPYHSRPVSKPKNFYGTYEGYTLHGRETSSDFRCPKRRQTI